MFHKMNMFTTFWNRLKNYIFRAPVDDGKTDSRIVSRKMEQSINLWYSMYINAPPWETDRVCPLGIPAAVCREIARPALVEFQADITGSQRADWLQEQFQTAQEHFLRDLEIGLALGGIAFKPYPYQGQLLVDATSAAAFEPRAFDASGRCIAGTFKDRPVKSGGEWYVRLEYHDLEGTTYTIRNRAFHSDSSGSIGSPASLSVVPEWSDIDPDVTVQNLEGPLFAYYRNPLANNVDSASYIGISVYSGAVDLIRQADEQWESLRWEYKSGRRKIHMDGVKNTADQFDRDLFEIGNFSGTGEFYEVFNPEFRDNSLYEGFQNILKQIEYNVGLSFGTISDPQTVDKTATEIRSGKQRMFVTVDSIQKALQHTFDALLYAMDAYATLYGMAPAGTYDVAYHWGDSVLDDEETKRARNADMRQDVAAGLLRGELYVAQKYGVTEEEAREMMPGMEALTDEGQQEIGGR